jgi:hypothetical protein
MQRSLRVALTGASVAILVACGGGGGTDPAQPTKAEASSAGKVGAASAQRSKAYIVQLSEPSVATYSGGIKGYAATRPGKGSKLDAKSPAVVSYRGHLSARHDEVLRSVGGARKLHSYGYTFNGFAAELSEAQAAKLASMPGVLAVTRDELRKVDTATTPAFLGLSGKEGFWKEFAKGEDVVIGIVDSGIWPELKSFTDRKIRDRVRDRDDDDEDEREYDKLRGWKGICVDGEEFSGAKHCNNKLIGARFYNSGFGGDAGVKALFPYEFLSPRDYDGHGTHTASTSGGNANVPATGPAAILGKVSGMAPRARIAAYKVCWGLPTDPGAGCFGSDSVAAIDQAVEDGVDVINFSISGTATNFLDPVELAFLDAASAGVFVAASAGNAGPAASTVAHPSPWITTVAAGTHNRSLLSSATLGNGVVYTGASAAAAALPAAALIDATAAGLAGADPDAVRLCFSTADNGGTPVLDQAKIAGKVVICDRGVNARVSKSEAVAEAGGVGMILVNTSPNSLNADFHSVPTVHLQSTDRAAVKAYALTTSPTAAIAQASIDLTSPAPFTAAFSSRGPSRAAGGNLLKPDIIAPGQDILAGVAPAGNNGREYDLLSGTSMSSPHIAGIAALMKELHPKWSPMAIKSALMTSAGDVLDGANTSPAVIFSQGAGHVQPNQAADPGLVFDSDIVDWLGFLCGTQVQASFCTSRGIPVLNPSNLNQASIAIGSLAGEQTVTRRVTNVSKGTATYTASVAGMAGYEVTVSPSSMTLARGQTKSFTVKFKRTDAALNAYTGGQLTLAGGTSKKASEQIKVRVPMVARPVALAAPAQASDSYSVTFGYTGAFSATARGLVAAQTNSGSVSVNQETSFQVTVPAGTTLARFSLFDTNVTPGGSDLDMVVVGPAGAVVGTSGGPTTAEEVNVVNPAPGVYTVFVQGFAIATGTADFTLFSWSLGSTAAGNMTIAAPTQATTGATATIGLTFTGLAAGAKYLGAVDYAGTTPAPASTIIRVDR